MISRGQMAKETSKPGLWSNIHAKRKRIKEGSGEKMRKPGSKGAPTDKAIKKSQGKKDGGMIKGYMKGGAVMAGRGPKQCKMG